MSGLAFSDAKGLHAGEKIDATLEAEASGKSDDSQWNARLSWRGGEVFWQPFFAAAKGQRLDVEGTTARGVTQVRTGTLEMPRSPASHSRPRGTTRKVHSLRSMRAQRVFGSRCMRPS